MDYYCIQDCSCFSVKRFVAIPNDFIPAVCKNFRMWSESSPIRVTEDRGQEPSCRRKKIYKDNSTRGGHSTIKNSDLSILE